MQCHGCEVVAASNRILTSDKNSFHFSDKLTVCDILHELFKL